MHGNGSFQSESIPSLAQEVRAAGKSLKQGAETALAVGVGAIAGGIAAGAKELKDHPLEASLNPMAIPASVGKGARLGANALGREVALQRQRDEVDEVAHSLEGRSKMYTDPVMNGPIPKPGMAHGIR